MKLLNLIQHNADAMWHNRCLNPSSYSTYHSFNTFKIYILPTLWICKFSMHLRSVYLIGFRNLEGVRLLRGMNCIFLIQCRFTLVFLNG